MAVKKIVSKVAKQVPLGLFVFSILAAAFASGNIAHQQGFPSKSFSNSVRGALDEIATTVDTKYRISRQVTEVTLDDMASARFMNELDRTILWGGGALYFHDLCPQSGCLAVEYGPGGEVQHVYPLRRDEIIDAIQKEASWFKTASVRVWEKAGSKAKPFGITQYRNGDLLVVFHNIAAYPNKGASARIDRNGHIVWFRLSNHHDPHLSADEIAYIPAHSLMDEGRRALFDVNFVKNKLRKFSAECTEQNGIRNDVFDIISPDGTLLKRVDLTGEMLKNRNAAVLFFNSADRCDPLHTNSIEVVGPDAGGTWGLSPGDLVVSMRNLSAFAILDGNTHVVKRLVRGTFALQHSVRHLSGSKFVLFDNRSGNGIGGASRVMVIDIADGSETTLFPSDTLDERLPSFPYARIEGDLHLSKDRTRAIASFGAKGYSVEFSLSDGEILNVFRNLHNISYLQEVPENEKTLAHSILLSVIRYVE